MEKNKWSFIFKQIVWGIVLIVPSVYLIYRGVIGMNFLMILGGIIFIVISIGFLRVAVNATKGIELISDEELDTGFAAIRSHVKESLIPIGFEEEDAGFGNFFYRKGDFIVQLSRDIRDQNYLLQIANKTKTMAMKKQSLNVPDFEISISFPLNNIEEFKSEVYEKISEWIKEQNLK